MKGKKLKNSAGNMNKKSFAPITLFVYDRLDHTQQTIESLKLNKEAKKSTLYIFSDAPKNESVYQRVQAVRKYIHTIKGFKKIKIIERVWNYGVAKNLIRAVTEVINEHKKIIIIEDDNVPSIHFLKYMNDALETYKDNKKVGTISGFTLPLKGKLPKTFFLSHFSSWAWATWEDRWKLLETNGETLYNSLKQKKLLNLFNARNTTMSSRLLRNQIKGNNDSWAILWFASLIVENKLTLYSKKSLIQNIGFDDTGSHCWKTDMFHTETANHPIEIKPIRVRQDLNAYNALQKYFKSIKKERIWNKIKKILKNPLKELNNL